MHAERVRHDGLDDVAVVDRDPCRVLTELRGGTSAGGENPNSGILSGDLKARVPDPDGELRFGIAPSAVLAERRQLFARGFAELELRLGRVAFARLRQGLGYGTIDFSPLSPRPEVAQGEVATVQPPPAVRFLSIEESDTSFQVEATPSRRLRVVGSASWTVAGGADAESRLSVPLARGPQASAGLEWSASPVDRLRFEAGGADTRFSNDRRASVARFTAGWRRQLFRDTQLSFSAGPGIGRAQTADQRSTGAYAVAAADLRATARRDLSVSLGAAVEPLGDPLSGALVERASARASITLGRPGAAMGTAQLLVSRALTSGGNAPGDPQAGDRYLQGDLSAVVPLSGRSRIAAGIRGAYLSRSLPGQPPQQLAAFVSYAAQLPLLR